jgi:hypothetical protein
MNYRVGFLWATIWSFEVFERIEKLRKYGYFFAFSDSIFAIKADKLITFFVNFKIHF